MIKLYIHNKPLFLVDKINAEVDDYLHRQDTIFIDELNAPAIRTMLQQLEKPEYYAGVLLHPDCKETLNVFKSHLTVIVASGGLVLNGKNEALLIFRKGKWDLPKGKLDEGESLESCALREIEEETGVNNLEIEQPLVITYHTYHEKEKHILKESHWYLVRTKSKAKLKPQTEEDIEKCEWVPTDRLSDYTSNMHASIIDVIKFTRPILESKKG